MRKGIVMEVNDPYLTLLTPDGEFMRARKMDRLYSIGEEIDFFPVSHYKEGKTFKNLFKLRTVMMSMAVLLICLASIIPVYQSNKAYAYMSIDADTSIEMGLNKNMQVVELKGFNKEADEIISQLEDWEKKDAAELTSLILGVLKDEGHIVKEQQVVISTVKTYQLKDEAAIKLQKNIDKIKQKVDKNLVKVNMYTTTKAELEKALDSGVPVGKYHRSKNASAQNKQIKEKIKDDNLTPSETSAPSSLPPGQVKKQEQTNSNPTINNNQHENNNNNVTVEQPTNGKQASPEINKDGNKGSEKRYNQPEKQKEKQKQNNSKHDKQKTNNHNKSKK
jgi:hypothetical protein